MQRKKSNEKVKKNAKYKSFRERKKLYLKNLKDAIKTRNNDIRKLEKDHE